jgi:hypothetical protein
MKTLNPSFKGGVIQPLLEVIYLNQQNYKNHTFNVLQEYLFDVQIVFYLPKNHFLTKAIDLKIGVLKAAGLVNLWMERHIDKSYIKIKQLKTNAKIMNIQQLSGGFQILFCGLFVSSFAFLIELVTQKKNAKFIRRFLRLRAKVSAQKFQMKRLQK